MGVGLATVDLVSGDGKADNRAIEGTGSRTRLEPIDSVLLAAFAVVAGLGIWTRCLMVNDGAVCLSAAWLGNAWDLCLSQFAGRWVSSFLLFGPAWAARSALGLSSDAYMTVAHALYFAVPLALWLMIRAVEPHAVFSRLYLAVSLAFVYFPTELIVGAGLWMTWAAFVANPARSAGQVAATTLLLGIAIVFTHAAAMLISLLYLLAGSALSIFGRPFPRRTLVATAAMTVLLLLGYLATNVLLPSINPTAARALLANRYDFVDPWWMLATLGQSPMLIAMWLLMIAPGANAARLRWRVSSAAMAVIAAFGVWFAVNGVSQITWVYVRHTGTYALVLALALAIASPLDVWLAAARRALAFFAVIAVAAAASYSVDLVLLERFVDRHLAPGIVDAEALPAAAWPPQRKMLSFRHVFFKWTAGADYVRDVVVADYDWYLVTLAFQSFFLSQRSAVLFHRVPEGGWIVFECAAVKRALDHARDELDAKFLRFVLAEGYCVP
jgi:hypothetical protein